MKTDVTARIKKIDKIFLATVLIPTLIACVYFGILASDVYVSESEFVVRSPDKPAQTGLGVLLKSTGFANAGDEVYAAENFLNSRDALRQLMREYPVERTFRSRDIATVDRFDPLGISGTFEDLYNYYTAHVRVSRDTTSSITTLTVKAYSADDAERMNRHLLQLAENLVNRLNERGRTDMIGFARREVEEAEAKSRRAAVALSRFRNANGVVDPEKQATVQLQMISKLQDEVIATRTQLAQLKQYAPRNPQIAVLQTQDEALARQMNEQLREVAGNNRSLAGVAAEYQRLQLESQFSDRQLAASMLSLQDAENEARRKQAYVERIVQPSHPDKPLEPRRLRGIVVTFLLGLVAWGILSMLLAGVREHKA